MKSFTWLISALVVVATSNSALANPVEAVLSRARQVPHTSDVQVTIAFAGAGINPTSVQRDGAPLSVAWADTSFEVNGGSGVSAYLAKQFCDCSVSLGTHQYVIGYSFSGSAATSVDSSVTVVADCPDPPDAGTWDGDAGQPWDQPDPTEMQGIDCTVACAIADGGATTVHDAAVVDDGGGSAVAKTTGSSCAFGDMGHIGGLGILVSLAVLLLLLRRRARD